MWGSGAKNCASHLGGAVQTPPHRILPETHRISNKQTNNQMKASHHAISTSQLARDLGSCHQGVAQDARDCLTAAVIRPRIDS